jgi:hypothetical protein
LNSLEEARLKLVCGFRSRGEPIYFAFGTCIHWMLEKLYKRGEVPTLKQIKRLLRKYGEAWSKDCPRPTMHQTQQQELVRGLASVVLPAYCQRWEGDFKGGKYPVKTAVAKPHAWVSLETRFRVPYTFPDGAQTWLNGTRDGLFLTRRGEPWGFDNKCLKIIKPEDITDTMPVDLQMMFYVLSLYLEGEFVPCGIVKNIIRRPGQIRNSSETLTAYLKRVAKDVQNPKKWDHYFQRYQLKISRWEVEEWRKKWLDPLMLDLRLWWEGSRPTYANPLTLLTKYGRSDVFDAIVYGNTDALMKQKSVMDYQNKLA